MEPVTSITMASAIAAYLAGKLKSNKSLDDFFRDLTDAGIAWIRPLFLKEDGQPKEPLQKLIEKPDSEIKQDALKAMIASSVEDEPAHIDHLREVYETIEKLRGNQGEQSVGNNSSGNIQMQHFSAGGDIQIKINDRT